MIAIQQSNTELVNLKKSPAAWIYIENLVNDGFEM
jgi:hypothetical protein